MKKYLFILSVATLGFAACSNDDVVAENNALGQQPKEIAFSALNQKATRAASSNGAIEGVTFPTTLDMKVTAWEQTNSGRDFFGATDFKYKYAGGSGSASHSWWGGDPAKYWPLAPAYINFLAITNANDDNETGVTWGNAGATFASKVAVAMTDNYAIASKQHDFLYAIGHGEVTQSGNTLTFPDKVDMTFKHTQAYLMFNLKAANAASTAIKIKNIEIYGARFAGTATINHTNYNSTTGQATTLYWNPTTQTNEYKCVLNDQTAKANEGASTALTQDFVQMGKIMVVPNMSAADTYADNGTTKIKITYYLDSKEYTYEYEVDNDTYEAGKKYVYDITFKLHEIFINPEVQDWDATGNVGEFVDIPNYKIGTDWNYGTISKAAATYKFNITGYTGSLTVATTGTETAFAEAPTVAAGVVTFKVNENTTGANRNYTIVVTDDKGTVGDTSDDVTSTITFTQAGS